MNGFGWAIRQAPATPSTSLEPLIVDLCSARGDRPIDSTGSPRARVPPAVELSDDAYTWAAPEHRRASRQATRR